MNPGPVAAGGEVDGPETETGMEAETGRGGGCDAL